MIFVLSESGVMRKKLDLAFNPQNEAAIVDSVAAMREKLTQYISMKTFISVLNGTATALFTWVLGIDFPFVWGVLTFMLNFVPNIGLLIAAIPPILLAFIQFDTPTVGIAASVGLTVAYNLIGNVLEPKLLGRALSLSPLVVFISLLFWGWYWGFIGVVLSIPLTVAVRIICEHITPLRPVAILMCDDPDHALAEQQARDAARTNPAISEALQ